MAGSSVGPVVKPGDPDGSTLYLTVAHLEMPYMPPESPMLPKESVELIRQWILGGALENSGSKAIVAAPSVNIGLASASRGKSQAWSTAYAAEDACGTKILCYNARASHA